jgi:hypothetical protein
MDATTFQSKRSLLGRWIRIRGCGSSSAHGRNAPVMLARIDEVSALDIEHLKQPISRAILEKCCR